MPTVEREVPQVLSAADTSRALLDHARALDLRAEMDASGGLARLRGGERFSFNPNTMRLALEVRGIAAPGAPLTLAARARALPWCAPRVRRALEGQLDFLARRLRGEAPGAGPFASWRGSAATGVPAALGGIWLSGLLAVLAGMAVMEAYGLVQVYATAARLAAQGRRIAGLGETPIPSPAALESMSFGARLAAASFFAVSLGWLGSGPLALAWGLGELVPRWSWIGGLGVAYVGLVFSLYLAPAGPLAAAVACAFLLPLASWIGYSLPWALRRTTPAGPGAPAGARPRTVALALGAFALLAVGLGLGFYRLAGLHARRDANAPGPQENPWAEAAVGFRDRILLGAPWGRGLTDFYYAHTWLPAEAKRHPAQSPQRVALLVGHTGGVFPTWLQAGRQWLLARGRQDDLNAWCYADAVEKPEGLAAHLDPPPDVIVWVAGAPDAAADPFCAALLARRDVVFPRLIFVGRDPKGTLAGSGWPMDRRLDPPAAAGRGADAVRFATALREVLDAQYPVWGVRGVVEFALEPFAQLSLDALVVGAGLLLTGLVLWSAWAWGAAGAAAAGGARWARRGAWVLGPLAALAAWAGLGATLGGAGGDACPPAVPLVDPVAALASPDPCERLDAAQQLVRVLARPSDQQRASARPALIARLRDPDPRVRFWAVAALGTLRDPQNFPLFEGMTKDPSLLVRYKAAEALGLCRNMAAAETLRRLVRDDLWYVANYARAALRDLAEGGGR